MNHIMNVAPTMGSVARQPRVIVPLLAGALSALLLLGCNNTGPKQNQPVAQTEIDRQTAFRVRSEFGLPLNDDGGWASDSNEPATVFADEPFRIRFEVEAAEADNTRRRYRLDVRRNNGEWEPLGAENFPQPAKVYELDFERQPSDAMDELWHLISGDASALSWTANGDEGHLTLQSDDLALLALGRYETHWEPLEFAVDLRLPEVDAQAGVVFGYEDAENYLRVDVKAGDAVQVVRVSEGRESTLATHPFDIKPGQWFELKLILAGQNLIVEYHDEALVFTENLKRDIPPSVAGLYVPQGGRADVRALVVEGQPRSPRTSIMASASFGHGAPTRDLLSVSLLPFTGGAGVSFADRTPVWSPEGGHSEWEFPIVIRRFSDEAALNESGDRFEYRLVDQTGEPLASEALASVTLEVADGHLGGTFVETPMRIGPWEASNGDLYFLMEPAETWNALMTVKSTNGGESWYEVDGAHRPKTGDLEGFASVRVDDMIHMLHQTSDHVFYHVFRTSDHPEQPDTWTIRDERLASPEEPPTQVADMAVRSDGSVVAVYGGPDKIHSRTRSPEGDWSEETVIDADTGPALSGPALVLGKHGVVHLAYTGDDGRAFYRQLLPNDELTERQIIAEGLGTDSEDIGSILPLVYQPESETVVMIYRRADGYLWERRLDAKGNWSDPVQVSDRTVVQNAVDADQTGADAIAYGNSVQVLFIEENTGHLYHTERQAEGEWSEARLLVDHEPVQWVRGALVKQADATAVYGYVYDGGADGGSGKNRYRELLLKAR
ncbi:hypothetical protein [Marinimicrobium sp. LS-A18]|uniref:hypothetical protein n=1 Tax=Marinimicrobium sp. LS-A18 TaxID=1381596 RepID=UPI00046336B8|nr:hypothetical protein [Marinimicrobium sp. LS-A18]